MKVSNVLIPALFAITFISCKKNNSTPREPDTPATITFTTPASGVIYTNGSSLKIDGITNDGNGISSVRVEVKNKATGVMLFQQLTDTGGTTFYRFVWNWTVTGITAPTLATVKVVVKDVQSNEVTAQVDVNLDN